MVAQGSLLPVDFNLNDYRIFQGKPTKILRDCDEINLGDRTVTVIHTPGHSPGHMCFWEADRGYLYSGDLVYRGRLFANYPSTDPQAYLASLGKISTLSLRRLLPGHHSLDIAPEIIGRMKEKFQELFDQGKLRHGQGVFEFGDWSLQL